MDFNVARPDVVRAINQRWLLKFWNQHLTASKVPQWQAVEAENLTRVSASLSFLDVIGEGDTARFQIRFHGSMIARVYGLIDARGRYVDEIIPVRNHGTGLAPYHQALKTGCPVYTIHDVTDRNGRLIHFERLLLPFTCNGESIDRILAAFEFICEDGAFDSDDLMTSQHATPALRLSATIEPQALV
jgi:hypothetical protein